MSVEKNVRKRGGWGGWGGETERNVLNQILRPLQDCLGGSADSSGVWACSCLPLSPWGVSLLFPHIAPEVSAVPSFLHYSTGCSTVLTSSLKRGREVTEQSGAQAPNKVSHSETSQNQSWNNTVLLLRDTHTHKHRGRGSRGGGDWGGRDSSLAQTHVHLLLCSRGNPVFW